MENSKGERIPPCLTPEEIGTDKDRQSNQLTCAVLQRNHFSRIVIMEE